MSECPTKSCLDADRRLIRVELERRARHRQTITYSQAASLVGRKVQGLGRILNAIRTEEMRRRRPDLGCLVVTKHTGFPNHVGPDRGAKALALGMREAVFRFWTAPSRPAESAARSGSDTRHEPGVGRPPRLSVEEDEHRC